MRTAPAPGAERLGAIPAAQLTPEQAAAAAAFRIARGTDPFGPFVPLLRSPEAMTRTAALGDYLRFRSALPPRLSELVILIVAHHWSQPYEWAFHYPIALQSGVPRETADAIESGRRPAGMDAEAEALFDFCTELLRTKQVSDATYARALEVLGERGIVDAVGLAGYYSLIAMVLSVARTPPPS